MDSASIPAISTGIYKYPAKESIKTAFATTLAVQEIQKTLVLFVCHVEETLQNMKKNIVSRN